MHPKGSRDPPPQPPNVTQTTNTLAALESQAGRYSALMRQWDRSDPAVAEIFAPFQYLTRIAIQELVKRARALVKKIGGNFQLDPKGRREHEEHESLKRMLKNTREDLTTVEARLDDLPQLSRRRIYFHPSVPDSYLSESGSTHPENPFHPSNEVLHLRGENSEYRDEYLALGEENMALREELVEKEAITRSLRDRLAFLEGRGKDIEGAKTKGNKREREGKTEHEDEDEGDFEDRGEGGPIRDAKRRKF